MTATEAIIDNYSYAGTVLLLALTGCGLPIPEEAIIVLAGAFSGAGVLSPYLAFPACILGVVLGDAAMYLAGYHGQRWLNAWCIRLQPANKNTLWTRVGSLLSTHPGKAMLLSHLSLGIRPIVYFAIGATRTRASHFLRAELICASIITSLCFWVAYIGGNAASMWLRPTEMALTIAAVLALLLVIRVCFVRRSQHASATGLSLVEPWSQEPESCSSVPQQQAKSDYDR